MTAARSFRSILARARRKQRWAMLVALLCASVAGVSAVGLLGLSGWFITGAALAGTTAAALAFNYMLPSATIRLLAILRTGCRYGERLESHRAALGALADIRAVVFAAIAAGPAAESLGLSTGEASARLVQDVDAIQTLLIRASGVWGAAAAAAVGVILVGIVSPWAGLSTAVFLAASVFASLGLAMTLGRAPARASQQAIGRLKDEYAALSAASAELVSYRLEDWAAARIAAVEATLARSRLALSRAEGYQALQQHALTALAVGAALLLSSQAPLPWAALAALAVAASMEAAGAFARTLSGDGSIQAASERLDAVFSLGAPSTACERPMNGDLEFALAEGEVRLSKGARLAVTGRSGSGKTTLLEQLIGLRPPPASGLRAGGVEVARQSPPALRTLFAYAPQEPSLLSGTVRENLRLANPAASESQIWSALFDAGLDERIRRLPQGLDSWIGEGGARLSGGERRRLSLARALLKPAPWLLLDEPTEGLDAETEQRVVWRLRQRLVRSGQGLILVSHRTAPLALCQRLVRLGEGGLFDAA